MRREQIVAALPLVFGLARTETAAAIGVSATTFDEMVESGVMPKPRQVSPRRFVWDVDEVRAAFKALPHHGAEGGDTWSDA